MNEKIIAPCGLDCFNCELYESNVTPEFQEMIANKLKIPQNLVKCKGCGNGSQCLFLDLQGKTCSTLKCAQEKGVKYCFECDEFPCMMLMPLADGASQYPHNIKLFNLCMMKKMGVENWMEAAKTIKKDYFTKKFQIGNGGK
jgi:hypothetical protein